MSTAECECLVADLRSGNALRVEAEKAAAGAAAAGGKALSDAELDGIAAGGQFSTGNLGFLTGNNVVIPINLSTLP
jgi:hypothetical protein